MFKFINKKKKKNKADREKRQIIKLTADVGNLTKSVRGLESKIEGLVRITSDCKISLQKLDAHQKEMSLQLDDLSEMIEDNSDTKAYVDTLIDMADEIEHFYLFSQDDTESSLYKQSAMMWGSAKKSLADVDIKIIDTCGVPLDTEIHSIESTGFDPQFPNGYVIKVLFCGYIYKGETIRRASIIVNKADNIITLEQKESEE